VKQVTLEFLSQNFFRGSRNDTAVAGYLMRDTILQRENLVRQKHPIVTCITLVFLRVWNGVCGNDPYQPLTPEDQMKKLSPFLINGSPKLCWGCGQPFPIRQGHIEALVGQDGQLYCYAKTPECAVLATQPVALKSAAWLSLGDDSVMRRFKVTRKPCLQLSLGGFRPVRHRHFMTCLARITRPASALAAFAFVFLTGTPAFSGTIAASRATFDGQWSVLIVTEKGRCDRAYRYPVKIENGAVGYAGSASFNISGSVGNNGAVTVTVSRGSQSATGTGRMSATDGGGTWTAGSGECSGTWSAERRS
jgi:hypothetical protein